MPTAPKSERKYTSWSLSRLHEYEECPFRAAAKQIDKSYPGESNAAMDRGNMLHKKSEGYTLKTIKKLHKDLQTFAEEFKALRAQTGVITEKQWEFDVNWRALKDLGRYNPDAWLRVKLDAHYVVPTKALLKIIDHKSGKIYEDKKNDQLELYGLAGLLMYPTVKIVEAEMWYEDQGKLMNLTVARTELPKLLKKWNARVKKMFVDRKFAPRPGRHCMWCLLSHQKGGPCKAG